MSYFFGNSDVKENYLHVNAATFDIGTFFILFVQTFILDDEAYNMIFPCRKSNLAWKFTS